jgi:hypothetical protein
LISEHVSPRADLFYVVEVVYGDACFFLRVTWTGEVSGGFMIWFFFYPPFFIWIFILLRRELACICKRSISFFDFLSFLLDAFDGWGIPTGWPRFMMDGGERTDAGWLPPFGRLIDTSL